MKTAAVSKKSAARPKTKIQPKTAPKDAKKPRKPLVIVAVVLLLALLAAAGMVALQRHRQQVQAARDLQADRVRFAAIEADMNSAIKSMKSSVGEVESPEYKSCSHVSLKFDDSQIACGIDFTFSYNTSSYDESLRIERSLYLAAINTGHYRQAGNALEKLDTYSSSMDYAQKIGVSVNFISSQDATCTLALSTFDTDSGSSTYATSKYIKAANYNFSCNSRTKSLIYTLAE